MKRCPGISLQPFKFDEGMRLKRVLRINSKKRRARVNS